MLREAPCGTVACSQPARETSTAADRVIINLLMVDAPSPEGIGAALETERPGRRVSAMTRPGAAPLHGPYATHQREALSTRVRIFYHFYVIHITNGTFQCPGAEPADAQLDPAHARLAWPEGVGLRRAARRRLRPAGERARAEGRERQAVRRDPEALRSQRGVRRLGEADCRREGLARAPRPSAGADLDPPAGAGRGKALAHRLLRERGEEPG